MWKLVIITANGIHWRRRDFGVQPFSLYSKVHSCTPVEHLASSPAFANEIVSGCHDNALDELCKIHKKIKMKKLRLHSSIFLLAAVLSSCVGDGDGRERLKVWRAAEKVNGYSISIIIYDSCQYLISDKGQSQMMAHKGNCKFCAARHSR